MIFYNIKLRAFAAAFTMLLSTGLLQSYAQHKEAAQLASPAKLAKLKAAVEAAPNKLSAHDAYLKAAGADNPKVIAQYAAWMKKYPKLATVPYAIAKAYLDEESPKAKPYLLKAVAIDPKFTEAWGGLWIDGERWGDFTVSRGYLAKAAASDPSNAQYAFYYASSFDGIDETKWKEMSLDVAKRFPNDERGAQSLYWLAERSKRSADKMKYFELLHNSFAPGKFNWSAGGMFSYFNILLSENPEKALELAREMVKTEKEEKKEWPGMVLQAQAVAKAKVLMDEKKGAEAFAELKQLKMPRYSSFKTDLELLKAQANDIAGNTAAAYDSLIVVFAKSPSAALRTAIGNYGNKLGKNTTQTDADIWGRLNANAQIATPFNGLKRYLSPGTASLSDYKGKVVLLTYWFPGCGPCRGEFPHFENVVRKFKGQNLEYLGINIVSQQNDYVVPFVKSSGYSFTPLEEVEGRAKGNLDNRDAAPMNFLIDKEGRLIFSNFRTDGNNEEDLELMINLLLNPKQA
ncbi:thiol-disulfide isomerase/thioredoxin [Pedobacter africanus]|uniref:Thiol-disulfide isomerase/thioredoxin n=1 Tax=Pedobacter africanus TaxID=151894 RepID=A0ACC6KYL3_9SPHI|nr:TlpA disulfide reductase family protein [Pedobacter africanus]MDR6784354.1 thiol-disulfide isomerase/thioredoxin [Pedobacter africanus]